MIKISKNYLIVKDDRYQDYEISLTGLNTPEKLEEWLCHLTEKRWFSLGDARQMAIMCEEYFCYKFNGKYQYDEMPKLTEEEKAKQKQKIANIKDMLKAQNEH